MTQYSKKERWQMTLQGQIADRPPVTAYRHFPKIEGNPDELAATMIDWQEKYDWDFIKIHPAAVYMQEVWGDRFDFGTYLQEVFPQKIGNEHKEINLAIFERKSADNKYLQEQVKVIKLIQDHFKGKIPVLQTLFTPLQVISGIFDCQFVRRHFAASRDDNKIFTIIKEHRAELLEALENITQTYITYWKTIHNVGADGLFYAGVSWARDGFMQLEEWQAFIEHFDKEFLQEVKKDGGTIIYHTCGIRSNPQRFADFPIDILHWDQGAENNPSLKEGRKFLGKIIPMGGVDEMIFGNNAEEKIAQLTRKCVEENKDIPYVLAPYCSVSVHSSDAEMRAFRENADALIKK